jgi:hypothetical protein
MSTASTASPSRLNVNSSSFWDLFWRASGVQFVGLCIIGYVVYGDQPQIGAAPDAVVAFYHDHHARILIAAFIAGLAVLYLMWFAAAIRVKLADAGVDGWGSAATASSAAVGAVLLLLVAINAGIAYAIAESGNPSLVSSLNDLTWSGFVLSSFVRAMLIMSAAFGFWRAGIISNALFAVGLTAVVLTVLGGTTWVNGGFWAPDGAYSHFISPILGLLWALVVSWVLLKRSSASRTGW